ncbi:unnamed protein product [Phaedon cochleariae]|uniref:C2H2-type domain-containing protein n=1 Tax=Phaedon cochleariae TaxID=80249 RepID=A0A9P0GPU3_PHACE|nr:unnamed protein product [Phaedon cochleariae]
MISTLHHPILVETCRFLPIQYPHYRCGVCWRKYKSQKNLNQHQRYECQKEPQFCCPYCQYKAKHKFNLNKHLKRIHV